MESARKLIGKKAGLETRVDGLAEAVTASRGRLPDELLDPAESIVERAGARLRLSSDHTVVAIAGATGSGKSSTFNALTGLDLAAVGVRRPTTSWATACIWGASGAKELLEWLGIPERHQVVRDSMLDSGREAKDLKGLVLLDLPDHDSTELSHHLEVERLVRLADLMVWVLDPQKYADAAVHERFLRPMAANKDVMLVVLNHIDEVRPERRDSMVADVRRLLEADGLAGVPVLATSAKTGEGIAELKRAITKRVADKASTRQRFEADVRSAAEDLHTLTGDAKPRPLAGKDKQELLDAVADAAGVPRVVDAVERSSSVRARRATGWPVTSWVSKLRPDPLKRLHLDLGMSNKDLIAQARSSIPEANQVQQARVEAAVRGVSDTVAEGLTKPWAAAVRRASTSRSGDLKDGLDRAVTETDLGVSAAPLWCRAVQALQWLLLLTALGGGLWLLALMAMGYLQMPEPSTPKFQGFPVPTLMLVLGIAVGVLLALVSRVLVGIGARARARRADKRLRAAVETVTEELVVAPVNAELEAYQKAVDGLKRARG